MIQYNFVIVSTDEILIPVPSIPWSRKQTGKGRRRQRNGEGEGKGKEKGRGQGQENVKGNKEGRERGIRRRHFDLCSGPKRAIPALCNNEKKN